MDSMNWSNLHMQAWRAQDALPGDQAHARSSSASPYHADASALVQTHSWLRNTYPVGTVPQNVDFGILQFGGASDAEISDISVRSDVTVDPCCVCYLGLKDGQSMVPLGCGHPVCLECAFQIPHGLCPICRAPTLLKLQEDARQERLLVMEKEAMVFRTKVCWSLSGLLFLLTVYCASQYAGIAVIHGSSSGKLRNLTNFTRRSDKRSSVPSRINGVPKRRNGRYSRYGN
eukprot:gnl/MRDRNA2_/MRDRNA2_23416_c0_seq1.p1 gnl/MRDRNA2_/MRDRNA2_23416_c0~~gnl/MRDRNA2_/MRDRNA2_23416_c0_seq1.p1  ORF type:complete len:263 (+),score=27.87 gnl/MRDRNA2_/MRDRNA2_23416_c0_seq1:102-791(+)